MRSAKKKKTSKVAVIPPEEWDFRRVSEKELPTVLEYEYARSNEQFAKAFLEWLKSTFPGFSAAALQELHSHRKQSKRLLEKPMPVREALRTLREYVTASGLPRSEVERGHFETLRKYTPFPTSFSEHFPTPWLCLQSDVRKALLQSRIRFKSGGLSQTHRNTPVSAEQYAESGRQVVSFSIAWKNFSNKELLALFDEWLQARRPQEFPGKTSTGKASQIPFYRLKQLAAWRLRQAGYSNESAVALIAKRRDEDRTDSESDVLPLYNSSGSWSKAVRAAADLLEGDDMFQRLYDECASTMLIGDLPW